MSKGPVLIFDFDGTICDSFQASIGVMNALASQYGFEQVPPEVIPSLRGMTFLEFLAVLKLPALKVPLVLHRGRREMRRNMGALRPIAGVTEALGVLINAGYTLGILTSNSKENVKLFLEAHQISCFEFIHAYSDLFGKSRGLRKLASSAAFKSRPLIYIGDEVRDIEACHAAKMAVIGVTWGFNTPELLKTVNPHALAHHPQELLLVVQGLLDAMQITA